MNQSDFVKLAHYLMLLLGGLLVKKYPNLDPNLFPSIIEIIPGIIGWATTGVGFFGTVKRILKDAFGKEVKAKKVLTNLQVFKEIILP